MIHTCKELDEHLGVLTIRVIANMWAMYAFKADITIYDLKYCPFCGHKLEKVVFR